MGNDNEKKCGVCKSSPLVRNNYFHGKLMTVRDYVAEQDYFNEKRWLINRMVNGRGVVCGLDVTLKGSDNVCVTPGMAIDSCGREIAVCEDQSVPLEWGSSECNQQSKQSEGEEKRIICIEYYECKTEPLSLMPIACDQKEKGEHNRIMDYFKIRSIPYEEPEVPEAPLCPLEDKTESLHRYVCDKLREEECKECGDCDCVILAIVTKGEKGEIIIDNCSERELVYSNPLLYDLIHCFHKDAFHVTEIKWKHAEEISWSHFKKLIGKGLTVTFDRNINSSTVNKFTFLVDAVITDESTSYDYMKHIPAETIEADITKKHYTFTPSELWIKDNIEASSILKNHGGIIRITLKSDFITDENGIALDGNHIGGKLPSGNGTEGGDFVSWFVVKAKIETRRS